MTTTVTISHHQGESTIENVTHVVETDSAAKSLRVWSDDFDRSYRTFHNARVTNVESE